MQIDETVEPGYLKYTRKSAGDMQGNLSHDDQVLVLTANQLGACDNY